VLLEGDGRDEGEMEQLTVVFDAGVVGEGVEVEIF